MYDGPLEEAYDDHFEDLIQSYPLTTNTGLFGLQPEKAVGTLKVSSCIFMTPLVKLGVYVCRYVPTVCVCVGVCVCVWVWVWVCAYSHVKMHV